jgi:hypothetical protein
MAVTYRVLGQSNPAATTLTTLYTVPGSTSAVCSTLCIANLAASAATYRVAVRPAGAAIVNQHYIAYDASIPANDSIFLSLGMTLGATDVVSVYASTTNLAFSLFGSEMT